MKHPHSVPVTPASVHAARKVRTTAPGFIGVAGPRAALLAVPRDREIREIAYTFYEARGRVEGHEVDDRIRAEAQADGRTLADPIESIAAAGSLP